MDLNEAIVEQQVSGIVERLGERLPGRDVARRRSAAFVLLAVRAILDLDEEAALDRITEGEGDEAVDAIDIGDISDGEFAVTLFQAKLHKQGGTKAFPTNEIKKVASTVALLFDPDRPFHANERLLVRVEEVRSLVREGNLPSVRVVLVSNGKPWDANGRHAMEALGPSDQVSYEHLDADRLVDLLRPTKPVDDTLRLSGRAVREDLAFRGVLVGRMPVTEVAALLDRHGDRLLDQNIRRFLGSRNRVNRQIEDTLVDPAKRSRFYFFNNGLTMVCREFKFNELQAANHAVPVRGLQIINGGQTCWTIRRVLEDRRDEDWSQAQVMVRLYAVGDDDHDLVHDITVATNSQSPVDLVDLHANDPVQIRLEQGLADLGYVYLRKKGQRANGKPTITPEEAAAAVLAVWRGKPHLARFHRRQHFGSLYRDIFGKALLPAHVVLAVELVEGIRAGIDDGHPEWFDYGRYHLAWLTGRLAYPSGPPSSLTERASPEALVSAVTKALARFSLVLVGREGIPGKSLQAQASFFRRGDAMAKLDGLREWLADARARWPELWTEPVANWAEMADL